MLDRDMSLPQKAMEKDKVVDRQMHIYIKDKHIEMSCDPTPNVKNERKTYGRVFFYQTY